MVRLVEVKSFLVKEKLWERVGTTRWPKKKTKENKEQPQQKDQQQELVEEVLTNIAYRLSTRLQGSTPRYTISVLGDPPCFCGGKVFLLALYLPPEGITV